MKTWPRWITPVCFQGVVLFFAPIGPVAQNPKDTPSPKVQVLLADRWPLPTPITKDQAKWTLRGMGLDTIEKAEAIPKTGSPIPLKILKKDKSAPPANRDPAQGGDSQLELEFPVGFNGASSLRFHLKGNSAPLSMVWLEATAPIQPEKEPNGGFAESQPIVPNQLTIGTITPAKDVDVFTLTPPSGSKSLILSWPKGDHLTLLRPYLMLHTGRGDLVKACEWDFDKEMVVPLPVEANFFLSITDQLDSTSSFHHYAFRVEFR